MYNNELEFSRSQVWYSQIFTPGECDRIIQQGAELSEENATIVGLGENQAKRKTKIISINRNPDTGWLLHRVKDAIVHLNNEYFRLPMNRIEPLQLLKYEDKGHYDW